MHSDPTEIDMDKPPLHATKKKLGEKEKAIWKFFNVFWPKVFKLSALWKSTLSVGTWK